MSPFTCPRCGRTSHHPKDLEEGYCGACHAFVGGLARALPASAIAAQRAGGTPLGPGMWADRHGVMHVSVPDFLTACGWPDDAAHRALVLQVVREVFGKRAPDCEIIEEE
jgi:hypothetical protein